MTLEPIIIARGVHFAASVLAAGTLSFATLIADGDARWRRYIVAMTWSALTVAFVSGAAWLLLLAADLSDEPGTAWTLLTETRFGWVCIARVLLMAAQAGLVLTPRWRWLTLVLAALFLGALAPVGHAGVTVDWPLASDVVHLLAAGAWVGGLPALAFYLVTAEAKTRATAVHRFGTLGLICVITLVASGLANAWTLVGAPSELIATTYGQVLLVKLALFVLMLGLAGVNRFHLTPRAGKPAAQRALTRTTLAETALGLGVLLLVGALGTLPPPAQKHEHEHSEAPAEAAFVHIHDVGTMADVTIAPGRVGAAQATIRLSREDGSELLAKDVALALDPPTDTARRIEVRARRQPDGSWVVQRLEIEQPGNWTVRVLVQPANGPPLVLDAPIVIAR